MKPQASTSTLKPTAQPAQQAAPLEAKMYQEKQAQEISGLKKKLQEKDVLAFETQKAHAKAINDLNKLHAERQKQYLTQIDSERNVHSDELAKMRKAYREGTERMQKILDVKETEIKSFNPALLKIRREAEDLQKTKNSESFAKIFKLQMELSALVKTNKIQVSELQNKMEQRRTADEQKILDMDASLKRMERECMYINATNQGGAKVQVDAQKPVTMTAPVVTQQTHVKNEPSAEMMSRQVAQLNESQQDLEDELQNAVQDNNEIIQELKIVAFENESLKAHIATLEAYIADIKVGLDKYIPMRDDACDQAMADKINKHKNARNLKNLFKWESQGLYQFGSKQIMVFLQALSLKISVKGTNGKVLLDFEEFVQLYTESELKKPQSPPKDSPGRISRSSNVKYIISHSPNKKSK